MDNNLNETPAPYEAPVEEQEGGSGFKKIIFIILGLIIIVFIVVGIATFILPRFTSRQPQEAKLTYWVLWEDPNPIKAFADEFTKKNPNVKITVEKQDIKTLGKYVDRLTTRIDNGTGPDIFRFHNSWVTQLARVLLPLPEDVVSALSLKDKYYPVVSTDLNLGGAYYGVPIHFDTLALFVNDELFKSAGIENVPTTWDDVISTSRNLTVKDSNGNITTSGIALGTFDNIAHASDIVSLLLIQNGADLTNLLGPAKASAIDGLDFYTSFSQGDASVWDDSLENSKLAFARGKLAMYIGYSWDIFDIKNLNPSLEFSVHPVPHLPGRENTIASYWVEGISSKTKFSKQAFEFLKFLASRSSLEKLYSQEAKTRLFGELYPRSDMADLLKDNKLVYPFVSQGKNAVSTMFSSDTHDEAMVDALNVYLGNAIRSIVNDRTSPESALETLTSGVDEVLGRSAEKKK